jgi:hypothetical protein
MKNSRCTAIQAAPGVVFAAKIVSPWVDGGRYSSSAEPAEIA